MTKTSSTLHTVLYKFSLPALNGPLLDGDRRAPVCAGRADPESIALFGIPAQCRRCLANASTMSNCQVRFAALVLAATACVLLLRTWSQSRPPPAFGTASGGENTVLIDGTPGWYRASFFMQKDTSRTKEHAKLAAKTVEQQAQSADIAAAVAAAGQAADTRYTAAVVAAEARVVAAAENVQRRMVQATLAAEEQVRHAARRSKGFSRKSTDTGLGAMCLADLKSEGTLRRRGRRGRAQCPSLARVPEEQLGRRARRSL